MFSNQFAGVVKTVCVAANMKLAIWVASRFMGYSWERSEVAGQKSEVGSQTTEDARQKTVLKKVESLKPLQVTTERASFRGRRESGRPAGRSNQRIMTDLGAS